MKILMIYPRYPDTFWSYKHALSFISKKAAVPPLGLLTVSAMLPETWERRLVDMNVTTLSDADIGWADYVFISAMYVQKESVSKVIKQCVEQKKTIVAGGPLFTQDYEDYPQVSHFILNEAEITLPPFLKAIQEGQQPERIYQTTGFADMASSPVPDYQLVSKKTYVSMNIQISRGCPFNCDFCEITSLLGHKVRMKKPEQVVRELNALYYRLKWRGPISIVDDNFIGNKKEIKNNTIPAIKKWMESHHYPFTFNTQTSVNIADDEGLMAQMTEAGITSTFIGIETPEEESLIGCNKKQNSNRDLLQSIVKIQKAGFQVSGGFIVGFDSDPPSIFQRQVDFIQKSGIVSAMVGLLNAPKNTKLYRNLKAENRLTTKATGNNTDYSINFKPKMPYLDLLSGYKKILYDIYAVKPYYKRIRCFFSHYSKPRVRRNKINPAILKGFIKSLFIIGLANKGRREYWKFLAWTLFNRPHYFVDAITYTVYGYHYRTVFGIKGG
jgi:radical SAM superfamily enzyme YgiQ (UPF0313 family)